MLWTRSETNCLVANWFFIFFFRSEIFTCIQKISLDVFYIIYTTFRHNRTFFTDSAWQKPKGENEINIQIKCVVSVRGVSEQATSRQIKWTQPLKLKCIHLRI